jgi:hypothetical protein
MMYVLGMSHAINVLRVISREPLSFSHENWSALSTAGQFFDVHTKSGAIAGDKLKAFIASRASGWGSVAELRTLSDGQRQVVAVDGFIQLLQSLKNEQDSSILFSFVHGNEHSTLSLVQHEHPYDFCLPGHDELEPTAGTQPIPLDIIRRQLEKALNPTIASLIMMRMQLPQMRLVHVLPPPPFESTERIMQTPEVFREQLARHGISPLSLRLKYYLFAKQIMQQAMAPFNVQILESPAAALEADGALKDEYAYGATHGNEAYGALVFEQMQHLARG